MAEEKIGHLIKLPLDATNESVKAEPLVECSEKELSEVLRDLRKTIFLKHQRRIIRHYLIIMFLTLETRISY